MCTVEGVQGTHVSHGTASVSLQEKRRKRAAFDVDTVRRTDDTVGTVKDETVMPHLSALSNTTLRSYGFSSVTPMTSLHGTRLEARSGGISRLTWTDEMDEALLVYLQECVRNGLQSKNGISRRPF